MAMLTLLIIRHAEKPADDPDSGNWPGPGLTEQGGQDKDSLVIRGWQRAGAWAALFGAGLIAGSAGAYYPEPAKIYAATPGDKPNHGPSRRPAETVSPLAARLGVEPDLHIAKGEEGKLVAELLGLSGVVLVAWEHKAIIADILPKIPIKSGNLPTTWPGDRFDVVLRLDRADGDDKFAFRQLFPKLLSGDSDRPLA